MTVVHCYEAAAVMNSTNRPNSMMKLSASGKVSTMNSSEEDDERYECDNDKSLKSSSNSAYGVVDEKMVNVGFDTPLLEYFGDTFSITNQEKQQFKMCLNICNNLSQNNTIMGLTGVISLLYKKNQGLRQRIGVLEQNRMNVSQELITRRVEDFDKFIKEYAMRLFKFSFTMVCHMYNVMWCEYWIYYIDILLPSETLIF